MIARDTIPLKDLVLSSAHTKAIRGDKSMSNCVKRRAVVRQQDNGPTKLRHWFVAGLGPSLEPECLAATPRRPFDVHSECVRKAARQWSN